MRKIRSDQARDYFQERVKVNAKTLIDMGDIMRRYPGQFTHQDVEKVRVYLMRQLEAALNGMNIAVSTAVRTDFDFNMEIPPTNPVEATVTARQYFPAPPTPTTTKDHSVPMREKPAGRLVGSKEVVKELVPIVPQRDKKPQATELTAEHDNTGMIKDSGFIDDAA
jgi:hypothetical protein